MNTTSLSWPGADGTALPATTAPRGRVRRHALPLVGVLLLAAAPWLASDYWLNAILTPFLILSLAGLGLNILTGYAGQTSLGSAAFMAVGAFGAYNLLVRVPGLPLLVAVLGAGAIAAAVGTLFGLPSSRIKGFYLMVSTLAAQFFVEWVFGKFPWFSNHGSSGSISPPRFEIAGVSLASPWGRYAFTASVVVVLTFFAARLLASQTGRNWTAIRDMDTAAAVIGIPVRRFKLYAFAVSSFYLGVAGVLWAFAYLGSASAESFGIARSFQVLFIIIIGGLGSLAGSFVGAAFMSLLPLALDALGRVAFAGHVDPGLLQNVQKAIFGLLIIVLLIKEPEGLARLLRRAAAAVVRPRR